MNIVKPTITSINRKSSNYKKSPKESGDRLMKQACINPLREGTYGTQYPYRKPFSIFREAERTCLGQKTRGSYEPSL